MPWLHHLLAILALTTMTGLWFMLQRWVKRELPEAPGVEGRQGKCGGACAARRSGQP